MAWTLEDKRNYNRRYRDAHRAEHKAYMKRYNAENKEHMNEQHRVGYHNNIEYERERSRLYRVNNQSKIKDYSREYHNIHKEERKLYYEKYVALNKGLLMTRKKNYNARIRVEVLTHYGNGKCACVKCGFDDIRALSLDHINGNGGEHRKKTGKIGGIDFYNWLRHNNLPVGYQTLCMNCQFIKIHENKEYCNLYTKKAASESQGV